MLLFFIAVALAVGVLYLIGKHSQKIAAAEAAVETKIVDEVKKL